MIYGLSLYSGNEIVEASFHTPHSTVRFFFKGTMRLIQRHILEFVGRREERMWGEKIGTDEQNDKNASTKTKFVHT